MPTASDPAQAEFDAATAYEALHVPALFGQWAPRLLDAAGLRTGERVLDVACGTGVLAREAVARVGPGGFVAGVDPAAGMLAVAAQHAPRVEWRQGTADALPYPDAAFDVVACQFGLMFFPDRLGALREMCRVAKPGGRIVVAVWDALERSGAYPVEVALLERLAGTRAADALRAPFVLGETDALMAMFERAGLTEVALTTRSGPARFPDVRTMVEADLRGWLPVVGVELEEALIDRILGEAETALAQFVTADGRVVFDSPAHVVTAVAPA